MLIGLALGNLEAFALARVIKGALFQVSATNPRTFAAISTLFLAVGCTASYLPARRATRMDPCRNPSIGSHRIVQSAIRSA